MGRRRTNEGSIMTNDVALEPGKHTSNPETKLRIAKTAEKIAAGWTKFEVRNWVEKTYKVNETSSNRYWNAALAQLCQDANDQDYIEEMRKNTISILTRAVQSEIAAGRYKEMNGSLELLSKLLGYNIAKSEVKVDGDIKFNFGEVRGEEGDK